jgi:hypothetical protein
MNLAVTFFAAIRSTHKRLKMKYVVLSVLLVMSIVNVSVAQNVIYDEHVEVRQVGSFSGIEVSGTVMLYVSQGSENAVAISAGEEKYNSKIKTEVVNGVLKISVDGGFWNTLGLQDRKLKAYVSVKEINRLNISGASYANINGMLKAKALLLSLSGASEIKGTIEADALNIEMSGASVARLSGSAKEGAIDASGASKINGYSLSFEKLKASLSGACNLRVTVTNELIADASGGSTLYYKGNGTSVRTNASGGASIKKTEDKDD